MASPVVTAFNEADNVDSLWGQVRPVLDQAMTEAARPVGAVVVTVPALSWSGASTTSPTGTTAGTSGAHWCG